MVDQTANGKVMPDFASLEKKPRKGAQKAGDLPQWAALQQKVFTNWINNKVGGLFSQPPSVFLHRHILDINKIAGARLGGGRSHVGCRSRPHVHGTSTASELGVVVLPTIDFSCVGYSSKIFGCERIPLFFCSWPWCLCEVRVKNSIGGRMTCQGVVV